ncbi:unnamed protein product [Ectocarpus sp. 6 AP-2014]
MLLDFPGLCSKGSLKCPQHGNGMLLTDTAAHPGDKVVDSRGCPLCSSELGGLGAMANDLVRMVDIRLDRGVIFQEVEARFVNLERQYSFPSPVASSDGEVLLRKKIDLVENMMKDRSDNVFESTQESLVRLKNLQAPNYLYPNLVTVEEVASGSTPSRANGMKRVLGKLRGVGKKEMVLHFLCPVDMTKVSCGYGGEGYRFLETRGWVKKISPVLQVAVVTAKVALKAMVGRNVDMSDFLKGVKDGLVDELADRILDEEALLRVASGEENVGVDMQKDTRASYEALKKLMDKEQVGRLKNARDGDGYVDFRDKMKRVPDGRGGMVWVRNENVQRWLDAHSNAAPSR